MCFGNCSIIIYCIMNVIIDIELITTQMLQNVQVLLHLFAAFLFQCRIFPGSAINEKRIILIIGDNRGRTQDMIFYNAILERFQFEVSTIIIVLSSSMKREFTNCA